MLRSPVPSGRRVGGAALGARRVSLLTVGCVAVALTAVGPAAAAPLAAHPAAAPTVGALQGTSALSIEDVWSVGYVQANDTTITPLAEHWNGTSWAVTPTPVPRDRNHGRLQGVTAISPKDVWAVGSSISTSDGSNRTLAEHWNGTKWKIVPTAEPAGVSSSYLQSVTAISTDDVWAVGYDFASSNGGSIIEHWDGTAWTLVANADPGDAFNASLQGVTAVSAKNVWAVGTYFDPSGAGVTLTEHWNGTKWRLVTSPSGEGSPDTELNAVTSTGAKDVWATGYVNVNGSTYESLTEHWDGTAWSIVDSPNPSASTNTYLYGVDAVSKRSVFATGYYFGNGAYNTLVEHWNGTRWKIVPSPNMAGNESFLYGVSAVSGQDAWVSGYSFDNGDVPFTEHWDGSAWTIVPVQ